MGDDREYRELRPLLFSVAYRMVGSVGEAEDIVQESFLRYHRATGAGRRVGVPKSYLCTVATRLSIDYLRSARVRRETYIGTWLPEPLLGDRDPTADLAANPGERTARTDSLSLAFLVLLETLTPVERAVFLLHDVFGFDYSEIAEIVEKTESNCRQLASRARRRVADRRPRFEASRQRRTELAEKFFAACDRGDLDGLVELLATDVVMYGDGGGKGQAVKTPVRGRRRVGRFLFGLMRQAKRRNLVLRPAEVNGQPGALVSTSDGQVIGVLALDVVDGRLQTVHSMVNPDKLGHLQLAATG
ncbi:MAG TPA: RNA polymerase sigma-70 factor [Actinomycetes bacterium]|nr:RNA polymerase sigma-70 factor [Actinomycetes bacterium]